MSSAGTHTIPAQSPSPLVASPDKRRARDPSLTSPPSASGGTSLSPQINIRVAGCLVDAYFPDHELVVELDSHEFHLNPISFETDRDRDADTLLAASPPSASPTNA